MEKIKVGGIEYIIRDVENIETPDGDRNVLGYCNYEKNEIVIKNNLQEQRKKQVLIHELTHAIFHEAGYVEQDEEQVARIAIVLHQVLKDNQTKLML